MFGITRYIPSRERGVYRSSPFGEIDALFNDLFTVEPSARGHAFGGVDIFEKDGILNVGVEIPGIEPEKLEVKIFEDRISIKGVKEEEQAKEEEGKTWYSRSGRRSVNYEFSLPIVIDAEKAAAKYENGLLRITAPKRDKNGGRTLSIER